MLSDRNERHHEKASPGIYTNNNICQEQPVKQQSRTTIHASWARGYKTFFMLNSAEHEIFSANKYENANNSWHFHIY